MIDKPAGLAVDRPRDGSPSIEAVLPTLSFGFMRPPQITHRLDRDTSGCLALARNPKAHKRMMAAFEAGLVNKKYLSILESVPEKPGGVIDLALAKTSRPESGWRIVADIRGKPARTRWRILATHDGHALILFEPESGRTHQLRVHAATGLGVPILGDPVYGRPSVNGMMLHAWQLEIPRAGKPPIRAQAPLPDRFAALGFAEPAS